MILTSPKVRARQTADAVAAALGLDTTVDERLADGVRLAIVDRVLRDSGEPRRPVLVGHDPDFSELLATLTGAASLPMKKGALARVDVDGALVPGAGVLRWLLPPGLVPGE